MGERKQSASQEHVKKIVNNTVGAPFELRLSRNFRRLVLNSKK